MRLLLLTACTLTICISASARPTVFWASDPVLPDETVLVCGDGFGDAPAVELVAVGSVPGGEPAGPAAMPDSGAAMEVLQPTDETLKFTIPADWQPGVYAFKVTGAGGQSPWVYLNEPTPYWCQGDVGTSASPGGWVRVFGRCLRGEGKDSLLLLRRRDDGVIRDVRLEITEATQWAVTAKLPADVPQGEWRVVTHNGFAGGGDWESAPVIRVENPETWPAKVFNVMDYGATGEGGPHDGMAVRAALREAEANGGGVVYLPRGAYMVNGELQIPRYTVLRGEGTELVSLFWQDTDAPHVLIQGTNHFGLENLTVYATRYVHCIAGELGAPDSGNTFLRRVRVRADLYRGHLTEDQVAERFKAMQRLSTGGGDTVRLGGENVQITDCDLYGSGRSLYLLRVRGGLVTGNTFYNGRWGWYCIDGSDGLILENNTITGADLMSTGGSLNCYSSAYSRNVYYAHNRLSLAHGWDREAMTTDAGFGAYYGAVTDVEPDSVTLAADADWRGKKDWTGAGVFILGGKGMGQCRGIATYDGRNVTLDRPWDVPPDDTSLITITMFQGNYLFIGNEFEDVGIALQYYGTSVDNVAAGNKCARGGGFYNSGRWYRHFQPSWYCQFMENEILEGNCYRFGPNNATSAGSSYIGTFGLQAQEGTSPLALCSIHRRNHLHNNAEMQFIGVNEEHPGLRDVVAEHNIIENAERGVYMDSGCVGVLLRENTFRNVTHETMTAKQLAREAMERRAGLLDQQEPVAHWSFDEPVGKSVADESGNRFWANATRTISFEKSIAGQAPRFDGSAYFMIADRQMLQFPRITVSAWVLPDQVKGRWGVLAKRSRGSACPYVLAIREGGISFEGTDVKGKWSYNFTTKPVVEAGRWSHIAAVCEEGVGTRIYCNGEFVGEQKVTDPLVSTDDILTIGYENWGGPEAKPSESGNFRGLIDEVKIWSRLLSAEEIAAQYDALKGEVEADIERREEQKAREAQAAERFQKEVVMGQGADWKLVKADTFDRDTIGPDWKTLRGKWEIKDGTLRCSDVSFLGYAGKVGAPVRIEFDARSDQPGDLTAFWGTDRDGYQGGYFMGFASNGNTANKLLRQGEQVLTSEAPLAIPGQWHHVIAQIIDGKVQLVVDGEPALEYVDPKPVTTADMAGIIAWSQGEFDNIRIFTAR